MDMAMDHLLLSNGLPAACMNSITAVGCMMVQGYVNTLGAVYTSAYSASGKLLNLMMLPGITAGFALSAFVHTKYVDFPARMCYPVTNLFDCAVMLFEPSE